ncbi:hypothetical protein J6590_086298 [Homalodisca vitripennis]|nr:hypothetical protein J6590_086298 [Homalodisca vitripennis]
MDEQDLSLTVYRPTCQMDTGHTTHHGHAGEKSAGYSKGNHNESSAANESSELGESVESADRVFYSCCRGLSPCERGMVTA